MLQTLNFDEFEEKFKSKSQPSADSVRSQEAQFGEWCVGIWIVFVNNENYNI